MFRGRRSDYDSGEGTAEINMTPLIDLTFLLLVTFMITFPALEQGITVKLPQGSAEKLPDKKATTVSIKNDGRIYLDSRLVTLDQLQSRLGQAIVDDPSTAVLVRADDSLEYGKVMEVVKTLYKVRVTRMALVTLAD